MNNHELSELIDQINKKAKGLLYPPPEASELDAFIKKQPVAPPPTYLEFLKLHNGWDNFWQRFCLIGVNGPHVDKALEDVKVSVDEEFFAQKNAFPEDVKDNFAKKEKKEPDFLYLPNHIIFATDFNGGLGIFDSRTVDNDGEMRVLLWAPDGITDRFDNFIAFLKFVSKS